ncbi:MAG: hypothetical protein SCK28_04065 [Bacillota bacterium]|nr:hypothetical protein [Bacillota bacterium]
MINLTQKALNKAIGILGGLLILAGLFGGGQYLKITRDNTYLTNQLAEQEKIIEAVTEMAAVATREPQGIDGHQFPELHQINSIDLTDPAQLLPLIEAIAIKAEVVIKGIVPSQQQHNISSEETSFISGAEIIAEGEWYDLIKLLQELEQVSDFLAVKQLALEDQGNYSSARFMIEYYQVK